MDAPGYQVSRNFLEELSELKRQVQILVDQLSQQPPGQTIYRQHLAYVGGSAITAASGTTAGTGTVTLKKTNGGTFETITDANGADVTVTVYNWVETASGTNRYVWIGQDMLGTWYFLNEAC